MNFGSLWDPMFDDFLSFFFRITFSSIDSALIFHRFWNGFVYHFWCLFDTFSVRARNLLNLRNHRFYNEFTWFYHSEKHDFDNLHDFCSMPVVALNFDECWHRFWLHVGTPLPSNSMFCGDCFWDHFGDRFWSKMDSILASLWHQFLCFWVIVFLMSFWIDFWSIWG